MQKQSGRKAIRFNKSGFTLIELLVVIIIIVILAAILFPVLAKARRKGHETACVSNLKQLGTAFMMYAGDYGGAFPSGYSREVAIDWGFDVNTFVQYIDGIYCQINWDERLNQGYVTDEKFWVCPGLIRESRYNNPYQYQPNQVQPFVRCYEITQDYASSSKGYYRTRDYNDPSGKILLAEVAGWGAYGHNIRNYDADRAPEGGVAGTDCVPNMPTAGPDGNVAPRPDGDRGCTLADYVHNNGSNYLMADGHVKHFKYVQTITPTSGCVPQTDSGGDGKDMWHATVLNGAGL